MPGTKKIKKIKSPTGRPKLEGGAMQTFSIKLHPYDIDRLNQEAERLSISRNQLVRDLIKKYFEQSK